MKFGKNLAQQQAKLGSLEYLDYKGLKKVLKFSNPHSDFDQLLKREIDSVNACFTQQVASIQAQLSAASVSTESTASLADQLRALMRISEQVEVLRRFAVWNAVAVVKILKKRTKLVAGPQPPGLVAPSLSSSATAVRPDDPTSLPTESWLSQQLFFSGSDFAELQASLESLASVVAKNRLNEIHFVASPRAAGDDADERCPICLDRCVDAVELSTCGHRFCWKCVVLGPIAFAPGEYRLSRCAVCRHEQPLDPTRNFKTVCSNQLGQLLSQLADDPVNAASEAAAWIDQLGLDVLFGSSSSVAKGDKIASEKERQTLDAIDSESGGHHSSFFFCSLCCEPLLLEAISTTPCKHHFHRVCLEKHGKLECPLCEEAMPVELVTPRFVLERLSRLQGGKAVQQGILTGKSCEEHRGEETDWPCRKCGKWTVQNLPPGTLVTHSGLSMVSYIHTVDGAELPNSSSLREVDRRTYMTRTGVVLKSFSLESIKAKKRQQSTDTKT